MEKRYHIARGWKETVLRPRERDVRVALSGIDLDVFRGEFFGILGHNGAGKTTLFKILATLVRPDEGTASVCGIDVVESPADVRDLLVPVIPSERSLYWRVSAAENLRLYARLYGLSGSAVDRRIREVLAVVGLEEAGEKQVGLFSSGMKQRLLIARALLGEPEILLLDEPTRSLDPVSARNFRRFLREEVGDVQGTTVLLASHDHEEVTELCDRVAVLDEGHLIAVGETESLLAASTRRLCSVWTSTPDHPSLGRRIHSAGGRLLNSDHAALDDGADWHRVRFEVPTDETETSELLTALVRDGVPISRFTRDDLSLADLLERVAEKRSPTAAERTA